jgi:hypothetical protein
MAAQFKTVNGQIIDPNGNVFVAAGIAIDQGYMPQASQMLADFPGLNFIRVAVFSYLPPTAYTAFIQTMTSRGIVVELSDYTNTTGVNVGGGQGAAFTGQQLTTELNWYSSVASAFASNPYVWLGTDNEPPQSGLDVWEQETYNAIRSTGNNNPVMIEMPGGGIPGSTINSYGYDPSIYAGMTNIVADPHFYGWGSNFSTNQATVDNTLASLVQGTQTFKSANGTIPVIIGEWGPATDGANTDPNGAQVIQAVQQGVKSGLMSGATAWAWQGGPNDVLNTPGGGLTSFGQEVAQWISSMPSTPSAPKPTSSANNTTVMAGSAAVIVDASGNSWSIVSGTVQKNGAAAGSTANVAEIAYANGNIWQKNTSNLWWEWTNNAWTASGTSVSPLPISPPTPIPSANNTAVMAGSAAVIVDASGNTWSIVSGAVQKNGASAGYTANVAEIAYANGNIWQENTSNLWWEWTNNGAWTASGTSVSPLPISSPSPTHSPNNTMVLAGSAAVITDVGGTHWSIVNGAVQENSAAAGYTANVAEIAYVNGNIWQENTSNLWWEWTNGAWTASGTSVNPLPAPITIAAGTASTTVTQSQISVVATSGNHMVFIQGSGDVVTLRGGTDTITDTGSANIFVLPKPGNGSEVFSQAIFSNGDLLDLVPALTATAWNGTAASLSKYLSVTDTAQGANISVLTSGSTTPTVIASITGALTLNLNTVLAHAFT